MYPFTPVLLYSVSMGHGSGFSGLFAPKWIGGPIIGIAVMILTGTSYAAQCRFPSPQDVRVTLKRNEGPVRFDNTRSKAELKRLQRRTGGNATPVPGAGWVPVGLTLTKLKYQMRVSIEARKTGSGSYCARLKKLEATIGYDSFDVFITRNFRPGTCAYDSIRTHEMTHVAVFKSGLNEFYPRIRRRLERAARALGTIQAGNPKAAAKRLQKRIGHTVDPLFDEMNRTLNKRNARLDTPERYRIEQARCSDW